MSERPSSFYGKRQDKNDLTYKLVTWTYLALWSRILIRVSTIGPYMQSFLLN